MDGAVLRHTSDRPDGVLRDAGGGDNGHARENNGFVGVFSDQPFDKGLLLKVDRTKRCSNKWVRVRVHL